MITPELLAFLSELKDNNNKDWFNERKPAYKAVRGAFEEGLNDVALDVAQFDVTVARRLDDPTTVKVFRIYKDVRFSKNKDPLKTNMSGFISAGGERPAYYLHIEPGQSMAGGGLYLPSAPVLKAIREEIAETYPELERILAADMFRRAYLEGLDRTHELKTAPRDHSAEHPAISLLKLKSFAAHRPFTDEQVLSKDFKSEVVKTFTAQAQLNAYLDKALSRLDKGAVRT